MLKTICKLLLASPPVICSAFLCLAAPLPFCGFLEFQFSMIFDEVVARTTVVETNNTKARSLPTDKLRIVYISTNAAVYLIQVCIWVVIWIHDNDLVEILGNVFVAAVSFVAALGFLLYGGRLFCMLRRFPIESKGRRKKLHETDFLWRFNDFLDAGWVCYRDLLHLLSHKVLRGEYFILLLSFSHLVFLCCLCQVGVSAFDSNASLDVLYHPILNLVYYTLTEIVPSALVLYILRKLPPKRVSAHYTFPFQFDSNRDGRYVIEIKLLYLTHKPY
ncbi:unnamed protein product [Spirodela intermedia]|uniref:THH1/TOM1/TOM3 domain-containing protein n=1 Tax=Spirodela intermedia TaxID=51605 RepID=A0A7I8II62_SPIIN|nr:unnamed protein product [Spirodela intermedia]CAA6656572.1 unnamed protein product [Spirodela intermedia]